MHLHSLTELELMVAGCWVEVGVVRPTDSFSSPLHSLCCIELMCIAVWFYVYIDKEQAFPFVCWFARLLWLNPIPTSTASVHWTSEYSSSVTTDDGDCGLVGIILLLLATSMHSTTIKLVALQRHPSKLLLRIYFNIHHTIHHAST